MLFFYHNSSTVAEHVGRIVTCMPWRKDHKHFLAITLSYVLFVWLCNYVVQKSIQGGLNYFFSEKICQ